MIKIDIILFAVERFGTNGIPAIEEVIAPSLNRWQSYPTQKLMTHGLTDTGRKAFADALREYRTSQGLTQAAFAEWLTAETKILVKEHNITVLEAKKWANKFDLNILFAVHNAQIIRHPGGTPYTFNDLMQMLQSAELVTV